MEVKTVYIAYNGRMFDTEEECFEFERIHKDHILFNISYMKRCVLPKYHDEYMTAKERVKNHISNYGLWKNPKKLAKLIDDLGSAKSFLDDEIAIYKRCRKDLNDLKERENGIV